MAMQAPEVGHPLVSEVCCRIWPSGHGDGIEYAGQIGNGCGTGCG